MNKREGSLIFIDVEYNSYKLYSKDVEIVDGEAILETTKEGHYFIHKLTYKLNGKLKIIKGEIKDLIVGDKKLQKKILEVLNPMV